MVNRIHLEQLILFGRVARDDENEHRYVDIMVVLDHDSGTAESVPTPQSKLLHNSSRRAIDGLHCVQYFHDGIESQLIT